MKVVIAPDQRLRVKTKLVKKIDQGLSNTLHQMIKLTKTFKDPEGVGLASTQIGLEDRFFVGKIGKKFNVFINPEIITLSKRVKTYFEGCLSIPNYYGNVKRSINIKVNYQDLSGKRISKNLKGIDSWIFQHEVDHLNGVVFPDRVLEQNGKFFKFIGKDRAGSDTFEEVKF